MTMDIIERGRRDEIVSIINNGDYEVPDIETTHEFVDGMYIRTMRAPIGSLIIGATHKKDSYEILLAGRISIYNDGEVMDLEAPYTINMKRGSGKIGYCLTDVVYQSIMRTNETNIEKVEEELFVEKIYRKELGWEE